MLPATVVKKYVIKKLSGVSLKLPRTDSEVERLLHALEGLLLALIAVVEAILDLSDKDSLTRFSEEEVLE